MINAVNGLLLMSVIVALIGIVNTLSLSILERRRELGCCASSECSTSASSGWCAWSPS